MIRCLTVLTLAFGIAGPLSAAEKSYRAGVATTVITPTTPLWMSGYAGRNKPCEVKAHDLYVKALAIEDADGGKLVLVTSDLCGVSNIFTDPVAEAVKAKTGLTRDRLMITVSHTHCGPVVANTLSDIYNMPPEEMEKVVLYTRQLQQKFIDTILAAMADMKPVKVSYGMGDCGFAVNRRENTEKGVINGTNRTGPVDHRVPVLSIKDAESDKLMAVTFGYACHNTTMPYYEWSGDYAGFAQIALEKAHPGAKAMFWSGCGGDANPLPRGKIELCQKYGQQLADSVNKVLEGPLTPIKGDFSAKYEVISLDYGPLPDPAKWKADLVSKDVSIQRLAARMVKYLSTPTGIPTSYPHYPVQVWKLGDGPTWVALGGEVVVDYSLRLQKELSQGEKLWVTAYANNVCAYIPSARVLKEGGYEADSSQIYYSHPTRWAASSEDRIIAKVRELAK